MFFWQDVDFGTLLPRIYNKKKRVTAQRLKSRLQSDTYTQWGATATHPHDAFPRTKMIVFLPALLRCESITSLFSVQLSAFNHARRSSHQTLMPRVFRHKADIERRVNFSEGPRTVHPNCSLVFTGQTATTSEQAQMFYSVRSRELTAVPLRIP